MFREKKRYGQTPDVVVRSKPHTFNAPLSKKWATPAKVFVCSWSDFFIFEADQWRAEAWEIIRKSPHLTFQICTKRPERIKECLPADWGWGYPNVWLGATTEDQAALDARGMPLVSVPAAVHFLSAEPLLGELNHRALHWAGIRWVIAGAESGPDRRLLAIAHVRHLMQLCKESDIAFFCKQIHLPYSGKLSTNPEEWPEDLRVREFPEVTP
jgi:protein gp37